MKRNNLKSRLCLLLAILVFLMQTPVTAEGVWIEGEVTGQNGPKSWVTLMENPTQEDLRTSEAGLEFLKTHEGYAAEPYGDYSQTSIGYGCRTEYAEKYGFSTTYLSRRDAHDLLICVVTEFEAELDRFLLKNDIDVTQAQYDALLSFTFNLGTGWFINGCRLSRTLIRGTYTVNSFASDMGIWCHAGGAIHNGLVNRRTDEIILFLDGAYDRADSDLEFCTLRYTGDGEPENDIDFFQKGQPYGSFSSITPPYGTSKPYFLGWYTANGALLQEHTIVYEDLTVVARWSDSPPPEGYEILELKVLDSEEQELDAIPDGGFWLSAEIYKALDCGPSVVMLVTYTDQGRMLDTVFLKTNVPGGTIYELGTWVDNALGRVGMVKAFVLSSLSDPTPLCDAAVRS